MRDKANQALTKLNDYAVAHSDVIDASWVVKVIEEVRAELRDAETSDKPVSVKQAEAPRKPSADSLDEHAQDAQIAEIVGPILREIYGDSVELGHYKAAIAAWKLGREGTLVLMGQLAKAKIRAEKAEAELTEFRQHPGPAPREK